MKSKPSKYLSKDMLCIPFMYITTLAVRDATSVASNKKSYRKYVYSCVCLQVKLRWATSVYNGTSLDNKIAYSPAVTYPTVNNCGMLLRCLAKDPLSCAYMPLRETNHAWRRLPLAWMHVCSASKPTSPCLNNTASVSIRTGLPKQLPTAREISARCCFSLKLATLST